MARNDGNNCGVTRGECGDVKINVVDDILDEKILVRVHGSLMIVAWIMSASIGIIISRYFKRTWMKNKVFGSDLWFFLHRTAMLITWSFTIIGFAVIFIDLDGWANPYPHEIFGIIGTVLCFIQPIIAMFRPNVSSPKRKYFNIAHHAGGTAAFGLAVIAMFLAVPLQDSGLPTWISWVMTGFLVFHLLSHVAFTMLSYKTEAIIRDGAAVSSSFDDPLSRQRKIGLFVYITINLGFVITMVTVIVLGINFRDIPEKA